MIAFVLLVLFLDRLENVLDPLVYSTVTIVGVRIVILVLLEYVY